MEKFLASGTHWRIFNFLLFGGLLFFALRKTVGEFWRARAHAISFALEEANQERVESGKRLFDLETRMQHLDREVAAVIDTLRQEGEQEKQMMVQHAEAFAAHLRQDTDRILEQEIQKARETLKRQVVLLSIELAERIVKEQGSVSNIRP